MSTHGLHVALSWGVTAAVFGAFAISAFLRQRSAEARLKQLDPRGDRA
ncbi:heme exporter protein CcmD [Falsiroseomonas sp. HW251]